MATTMVDEDTHNSLGIASLIYGTADQPTDRPLQLPAALSLGYSAIDTASNYTHDEAAVALSLTSTSTTKQIYIQTKYSPAHFYGTKTTPYDLSDSIPLQILKSVGTSLSKLNTSSIDVLLLHQPFPSLNQTYAAWEVFEEIHRQGGAKHIGICQIDLSTLETLHANADVKPAVVQNYFAKSHGFDKQVRQFCKQNGIVYQAFGVASAENAFLLEEEVVGKFAERLGVGKHAALLAVVLAAAQLEGEKFCVLDGSRDRTHLEENWKACVEFGSIPEDDLRSFPTVLGLEIEL